MKWAIWVRVVGDTTYRSYLREHSPGVYLVSAELMEQMMHELGWEVESSGDPEAQRG